jgi:uncharacterized protein (TIGR03435 family)
MRILALALLATLPIAGQTFDVATLKLSPPPKENQIVINLGRWQPGRFTMENVTLSDMMKFAYSIVSGAQLAVPDWSNQVRFDIEATAPPDTKVPELRMMIRSLLDERLHLKFRREQRVLPYLALVKGKSSPKMSASEAVANPNPGPQVRGRISHPQMSMLGLATLLSRFERETVVDQTGLQGVYQVNLEWMPESFSSQPDANAAPAERPSLFTAVSEQLGLKLESRRGPLEVLVVESASRVPEAN